MAAFLRAFLCFTLTGKTKQGLVLQWVTTAVIVYNLAEKIDKCPLNRDYQVLFAYN